MAQGGTIPTNRTQTVTFYNTTGIIEKEKGIYLSPSFKNKLAGAEVRDIYLNVLNSTAVKDADYTDIPISTWSPEDRTLTVRGNIDDFRLVTEEGDCLNYLVISRYVTKLVNNVSTIYKYYYGFFITGVAQAGGSSVKLTLEPDTFTNVFYLHNKHQLTALEVSTTDYEPFNERMKNCHVNRQHYNRVRVETSYTLQLEMNSITVDPHLERGKSINIYFEDQAGTHVEGIIVDFDDTNIGDGDLFIRISCEEQQEIGEPENYSSFTYENANYTFEYTTQGITWNTIKKYLPDNLRIFLNQEESFKFKYQYRDKRMPFSMGEIFTEEEFNLVKNTALFSFLPSELKDKIIKASIQYLVVEFKSYEKIARRIETHYSQTDSYFTVNFTNKIGGFRKTCLSLFEPFYNVPLEFKKFESDIIQYELQAKYINGLSTAVIRLNGNELYTIINHNALGDFIYGAYMVNDVGIPSGLIELDHINKKANFLVNNERNTDKDGLYVVPFDNNDTQYSEPLKWIYNYANVNDYNNNIIQSLSTGQPPSYRTSTALTLFGPNFRQFNLQFEKELSDLRNIFFDNVLEAEPYTFYSFSHLNYELPFNRNRYYEKGYVLLNYVFSVNGAIKIGYIPQYSVEEKEYRYYNESLTFTLPSNLPIVSDSYSSYYYQNQAQMKNQYAVNEFSGGIDLLQHFLVSGPNAVGQQAFRRGGYGAMAEAINQSAQMLDEIADISQNNKVIEMNQKAKLADMGAKPDVVKQTGSDAFYDLMNSENRPYVNHYTIDKASYDSIAKFLERFGYQINLYDTLHVNDRVGWNYIKLNSFDINPAFDIMVGQEQDLMRIFSNGVTLLHDKTYLTNGHNYETILSE